MAVFLHKEVSERVIAAAVEVYQQLGPGLLESAYEACMVHELVSRGAAVRRQAELPVKYKGVQVDAGFRLDLVVDQCVIVELKSVDKLAPIHEAQLLTNLRLSGLRVGLLFNFNSRRIMDGFIRRVL